MTQHLRRQSPSC